MLTRVRLFPRGGATDPAVPPGARTPAGGAKTAIWLPDRAVETGAGGSAVLVVAGLEDGRGTLERRQVEVGARHDGWTEVRSGLRAGDLVAADPATAPAAGSRVRASDAWRDRPEGGSDVRD
jgi:multidrug efflux pump subunit AcrA (membrane-fusion protein)